jgi:hypothetical protein
MEDQREKWYRQAGIQFSEDLTGIQFSGLRISPPAWRQKVRALILLQSRKSPSVHFFCGRISIQSN